MAERYLPNTDAGLQAFSLNFIQRVEPTPAAFGLTEAQATAYGTAQSAYGSALANATNPATRGSATVLAKNTARAALVTLTRQLVAIVQAYPQTTDEMRQSLGITIRKTPAPIPAPPSSPNVDLLAVSGRTVNVRVHDGSPSKRGKPPGTAGAWVYTFVGETYPTDPALWQFEGVTTRGYFTITFADSVPNGQQVWICAAWLNPRGVTGPVSSPITTNVQGGGVSGGASLKLAA